MTDADLDRLARGAAEWALPVEGHEAGPHAPGVRPLYPRLRKRLERACRAALGEAVALAAAMIRDLRTESGAYRRGWEDAAAAVRELARGQREYDGHDMNAGLIDNAADRLEEKIARAGGPPDAP